METTDSLVPIILAGGAGTRLWPLSRRGRPKPFLELPDGRSLFARALAHARSLPGAATPLTVLHRDYLFQARDAANGAGEEALRYLLEPIARNTAPAIGAAARWLSEHSGPQTVLLVLPADHRIEEGPAFGKAVSQAVELARLGYLVTFGIVPKSAHTGYGYIERGEEIGKPTVLGHAVSRFIEKPDRARAEAFAASGRHFWNAGIFCFRADALLAAMGEWAPEMAQGIERCVGGIEEKDGVVELPKEFGSIPSLSLDYAVMEKARKVAVVPAPFSWSDVGSWSSYADLLPADARGNRVVGEAQLRDAEGCVVYAPDRLAAVLGVQDLLVVDTPDALLIAAKDRDQEVEAVVAELRRQGHPAHLLHRTVHRPWGTYTVLEEGPRFAIKRIVVRPGRALSLQMHHHRSEHWVVVSGTAKVTQGEVERLIRPNESTYIPAGISHRLENPGLIDLVIIEVQCGDYVGEDDIVRFEDRYGRA
ncbi:MAG: mannose-1-phosphate guanylyltransferase/mannose-6-phosphate isomerase [Methylacidiphilaceae bacterium]|nr:mannose-1-phosphate guanylyltransferase/mannose-6-phosphate isomerase [Candidatus Methylacidiphilaceae bacterium]